MRRTIKLSSVTSLCGVGLLLVACKGGGGTLDEIWNGWDEDHGNLSQRERPLDDRERPSNGSMAADTLPNKKDPSPGFGPGNLVCGGTYECVLTGNSQSCTTVNGQKTCSPPTRITIRVRIKLKEKNGECLIGEATLEPNGVIRGEDGDQVGEWFLRGDQIIIKAGEEAEGTCIPATGPEGLVGIDGLGSEGTGSSGQSGSGGTGSSTSSSSSSSSSGDISIDPGPGQVDGGR